MMRKLFPLLVSILMVIACGCSAVQASKAAENAVDAYQNLVQTLQACSQNAAQCDREKIWNAMDFQTKSLYLEAYAALVRIDRIIETYFDPIEHKYMKAKTGTDILKSANIRNYQDLFAYLFKPEKLVFDSETLSGLEFEGDTVENANRILIQTHQPSQQFLMIREDDGVWRTAGLLNASALALDPIFQSESAMKEYAQGNLEAELKRRDTVRAYFIQERQNLKDLLKR